MPKDTRRKLRTHEQSVKLVNRQFAVHGGVQHVEVGGSAATGSNEILGSISEPEQPLKKKEKLQMKRDTFLYKLEASRLPYSKSHNRRLKRKAKEQIAGGLDDIQAAISAVEGVIPDIAAPDAQSAASDPSSRVKLKAGQIGEGKPATLSKNQRKRELQLERLRHPLILSNPEFTADPFQTIRTHAKNTLIRH